MSSAPTTEGVVARVKEITVGRGAWGRLDAVCGTMTATLAAGERHGGTLFLYGVLAGYDATINAFDLLFRGVELKGWVLYTKVTNQPEKCQAIAPEVAPLVRDVIISVRQWRSSLCRIASSPRPRPQRPASRGRSFL